MIQKRLSFCLLLCLTFLTSTVRAEWSYQLRNDFTLYSDQRWLSQNGFSDWKQTTDVFLLGGSQAQLFYSGFSLEVRPEIRALYGRSAGAKKTDMAFLTVESPRRWVNLDTEIHTSKKDQMYLDFERLNASYRIENFEFYAGRKAVSLGVLKVIPVWNKFTVPLPNVGGYRMVFGQDVIGFRDQRGVWSYQFLNLEGKSSPDAVRLAETAVYTEWIEVHALFAQWWRQMTAGLAFAKDLGGATLRGESLWVGMNSDDSDPQKQVGLGVEYAPHEKWTLLAEGMYLSKGAPKKANYQLALPSRFTPFRARWYTYVHAQYQLTALWSLTAGTLLNAVDGSQIVLPKASYSLSDNAELQLEGMIPIGQEKTEFSKKAFIYPGDFYLGVPTQVSAQVKFFF